MEIMASKSKHYAFAEAGAFTDLLKGADGKTNSKQFFRDLLGLTGMEMSINAYPANFTTPFFHSHKQNEELYIVLKGEGQIQLDDELVDLKEGSVVRVLPACARALKSGPNSELVYACIQAKDNSLEQCNKADGVREERKALWKS